MHTNEYFSRVRNFFKRYPSTIPTGVVAVIALLLITIWAFGTEPAPGVILQESGDLALYQPLPASGETVAATYLCPGGESFNTSYDLGSNELTLTLPDGNTHTLPQIPSAEEARFGAFDGSVVFYERLALAHVAINGEIRYGNCVAGEV